MLKLCYLSIFVLSLIWYSSANAHTNSIGFQATNSSAISCSTGAGSNCVDIEVFMGTYHRSTDPFDYVPAEGHAALFIQNGDGTENQVLGQSAPGGTRINFSTSHSLVTELPNFDGSNYWDVNSEAHRKLKQHFLLGTNYFFADGSNKALTSGPTNPTVTWGSYPYIFGHQSANFIDVGAGIYRLDYDAGTPEAKTDLGFDWFALPGISEAFFRVSVDGTVSIVMNPEQFLSFASFSNLQSLDNAASALSGVRPSIRTSSTEVGAFFEEIYNMPLKDFQNSMIQISGDIHGQVNNSVFSDIEISQASTINQFNRNRSNARVWFDVKDFTSIQKASVKSIGSSSNGTGLEIGKNWQSDDGSSIGASLLFSEQDLFSISGTAEISSATSNFFFSKATKEHEINHMMSLSNVNAVTDRKVQLDSMLNSHSSSYDFRSFSARSEYGRKLKSSSDMELKSSFGLSHQVLFANSFVEDGSAISKLSGKKENLEQTQISIRQETVLNRKLLGADSQFFFSLGFQKKILNLNSKKNRSVSLHGAHWDVGSVNAPKFVVDLEAEMRIKLFETVSLNAGISKHQSSRSVNSLNFSVSGSF